MRWTHVGCIGLAFGCGCLRFGYDAHRGALPQAPDASVTLDAGGARHGSDAGARDAGAAVGGSLATGESGRPAAEGGGSVARAGAGGAVAGSGADEDAGVDVHAALGQTGLRVSDILGYYSGDWGDMLLRAQGSEIWGAYRYQSGTIVGQITSDGVFVGWWSQLPTRTGADAGEVQFRWSQAAGAAIALDGRWRYGSSGDWLENWDVNLVTDRPEPSDLAARFDSPTDFRRHP